MLRKLVPRVIHGLDFKYVVKSDEINVVLLKSDFQY